MPPLPGPIVDALLMRCMSSKYTDRIDFYTFPLCVRCVMVCKTTRMEKTNINSKRKAGGLLSWVDLTAKVQFIYLPFANQRKRDTCKDKDNKLKAIWRFLSYSFLFLFRFSFFFLPEHRSSKKTCHTITKKKKQQHQRTTTTTTTNNKIKV